MASTYPVLFSFFCVWAAPVPKVEPGPYLAVTEGTVIEYEFSNESSRKLVVSSVSKRRDGTRVVIEQIVGEKRTSFETLELRDDGLYLIEDANGTYNPPRCELKASMKKGDRWTSKSTLKTISGFEVDVSQKYHVVGAETIKTSVGELETVRLEYERDIANPGTPIKVWYAMGIGMVKAEHISAPTIKSKPELQITTIKSFTLPNR